jgi:hypothetical protein
MFKLKISKLNTMHSLQTRGLIQYVFLFLLIFTALNSPAQNEGILDKFNGIGNNGLVYLDWVITSGRTCDGTRIFRSTDSLTFIQIGDIQGICGSDSSPQPFSFIDENPVKNKTNYYRLELGNNGYSDIVAVEIIDLGNEGYQVRPNPVMTQAKIYFENDVHAKYQLRLYDQGGVVVYSDFSSESHFDLSTAHLRAGVYIFTLSPSGRSSTINGRLLIQH